MCVVGPLREGAHVEHGVTPGVDAQINAENSSDVQHEARFYLKEQRFTFWLGGTLFN